MSHDVAIVTRLYRPHIAGAEIQAERLAAYVASTGARCEVVTTRFDQDSGRAVEADGIRVRRLATGRAWLTRPVEFLRALAYFLLNARRFDIVHASCLSSFTLGALVGARLRRVRTIVHPCVMGAGGDVPRVKGALGGRLLWRLFLRADYWLAGSDLALEDVRGHGVEPAKSAVMPGMATRQVGRVATSAERSAAKARIGLPDRPTVLYVGRLEREKGVDVLLEAWPAVVADQDAQLVLVGDGPLRQRAMDQASTDHRQTIRAVGVQADPGPFYAAAEVFVFPTRSETFGVALADAMAHGLAVVATPAGLAHGWLRDQFEGLLIPHGDGPRMATAIRALLANEAQRQDLGERARQRAHETFGVETVGAAYSALWRRLLADKSATPSHELDPADHGGG
jgi:glycosyltransferase involved in cell wall biosynthesis